MELTMERVGGQTNLESIKNVPKPSQLDDWITYERVEAEMIQQIEGAAAYGEWTKKKATQQTDKDK